MVRRNVVANYLGQAWAGLMSLVFVPVYIEYLGMEAYGLIGFYALLQAWLSIVDAGMSATLNREMARFTAGVRSASSAGDLLRSVEVVVFGVAAVALLLVWLLAEPLARGWLQAERLPVATVAQAISVMAFVVAARFCEGIYRGSLLGLQRQVWYNGVNAVMALVKYGGVVGVLAWVSRTIEAFFIWQAVVAALTVALYAARVHRIVPGTDRPPAVSRAALVGIWRFSAGVMSITALSLLVTQADKILLSRLVPLAVFGDYVLAAAVAGTLYLVTMPVTQALYPQLVGLAAAPDAAPRLAALYHAGAQLIAVMTAPVALLLVFLGDGALFTWTGDAALAARVAPILAPLALGTLLHTLMYMPYQLQLAYGWTGLAIRMNLVMGVVMIPALFWVVPRYGAVGAAWLWVAVNAGYLLFGIEAMHRRLVPTEKRSWYLADVLLPVGAALAVAAGFWLVRPGALESRPGWLLFLVGAGLACGVASVASASAIRSAATAAAARALRRIAGRRGEQRRAEVRR